MLACRCASCGEAFEAAPEGGHRLMCGDSTSPEDVATLTAGGEADVCFTSPPYGQQRDYASGGVGDWDALMRGVFATLPMRAGGQVLVNLGLVHRDNEVQPYWDGWMEWMRAQGWRRFAWYVWDQGAGLPGDWNGRLAPSHEFIFHFNLQAESARKVVPKLAASIKAKRAGAVGLRKKDGRLRALSNPRASGQRTKIPDSVIRVPLLDSVIRVMRHKARGIEVQHPAVFPVKLATEVHAAFSDPGDVVWEPFCGSGTSIISAQMSGRRCWAMELAGVYTDVAVRRWQLFTGAVAVRESDGRPFAVVAAERMAVAA